MPKILKITLSAVLLMLLFVKNVIFPVELYAQSNPPAATTWYNQGILEWYSKVYDQSVSQPSEIFGERYTAAQVQWILYSLFWFPSSILGDDIQSTSACLITTTTHIITPDCGLKVVEFITKIYDELNLTQLLTSSVNNTETSLADTLYFDYKKRDISGVRYLVDSIHKFGVVKEVNAQGFGYTAVNSLQKYWQGFRDVSYALIVLITIVFSFMIMFRVKLSPQLVISVQSALPKIFTALILATFSYAIAGFVIDLSYVVGGLFSSLMTLAGFSKSFAGAFDFIVPINYSSAFGSFYIFMLMLGYTALFFFAALWSFVGTFASLSILGFLGSFIFVIFTVWVLLLSLWYAIKIPIVLIKNLISLFVSIVVAPVQIVIGALVPSIGFGVWLKKIIAEALVFPVTGLLLFLAFKTINASFAANTSQITQFFGGKPEQLWTPPLLGNAEGMSGLLWLAISYSFIAMIPKAVDITKMLVMGTKFDFGTAINEANMLGNTALQATTGYYSEKEKTRLKTEAQKAAASNANNKWADVEKFNQDITRRDALSSIFNKVISGR